MVDPCEQMNTFEFMIINGDDWRSICILSQDVSLLQADSQTKSF